MTFKLWLLFKRCSYEIDIERSTFLSKMNARDWPCRDYHLRGGCEDGEFCKFSHDELTEETESLVGVGTLFENYLI